MQEEYVSLKQLAERMGLDKSNARKYVLTQGFSFLKQRTEDSSGQVANVLTLEDAEAVIAIREEQGFTGQVIEANGDGWFYIIQLIPEFNPLRVKLGFASNVQNRLQAHRTSAPTAQLVKAWPCKRMWEQAAMDSITRKECKLIASEVFECKALIMLANRGDEFFALMPQQNPSMD